MPADRNALSRATPGGHGCQSADCQGRAVETDPDQAVSMARSTVSTLIASMHG